MYIRIYMYIYIYKYINTSIYLYVEDLTVGYDGSVRNSEDNLVQVKPHPTYNIYIYMRCVACRRARFARALPSRLPYGVA